MFGIPRAGSFGSMFSILAKTRPAPKLNGSGGRMTPSWIFMLTSMAHFVTTSDCTSRFNQKPIDGYARPYPADLDDSRYPPSAHFHPPILRGMPRIGMSIEMSRSMIASSELKRHPAAPRKWMVPPVDTLSRSMTEK